MSEENSTLGLLQGFKAAKVAVSSPLKQQQSVGEPQRVERQETHLPFDGYVGGSRGPQ